MFIDQHPYLSIYLLGSLLAIILIFIKNIIFYLVDWIIKANILKKNLKKLAKPDNRGWYEKASIYLIGLLITTASSWIEVVIFIVYVPYQLIKVLRDLLTPAPEQVKALRFPLRNNPMLSKERNCMGLFNGN